MLSFLSALLASSGPSSKSRARVHTAESLEARHLLAAAGLVDVGSQPEGALSGKVVYVHGGHGITANTSGWGYQRPLLLDMVEDLGNQDQMSLFTEELWNAGATVVPLRPVGHQVNEVVLDNDDVEVTFTGAWSDSSSSIYFGDAGDVAYRFASTSATETATAQYRPDMPEAGYYPVYAWTRSGSDRAADQLYRVHHAGGATEVTVNHRLVGNGLVYLGTYYFEEGTDGYVEISNRSSESGRVVIADMIRFGNGMGDLDYGNGVSGQPRENEAGLYWIEWHVNHSQGVSSSTYGTSTVSAPPRYATYMNREAEGDLSDRVFVSFHSNAGGGSSRGVLGLLNGNNRASAATPNQFLLADTLARQVNDDLVAQNGQFENNWFNRTVVTLDRSDIEFGEINNERINDEFDATIIETGFHDNQFDAEMLVDKAAREAIARATYQGVVDYFRAVDGGVTADVDAPPRVDSVAVESGTPGQATITWTPGSPSSYAGDAPTGYMVYGSTNGYGFDGGTYVAGGATTSYTFTGLTEGETYYFRVAPVNAGGEGPDSEVVAVKPSAATGRLLIVNGFDRQDRSLSEDEPFLGGSNTAKRVRLHGSNTYDYSVQVAEAIEASGANAAVATASNEAVASGEVDLSDYDAVVWILGTESSDDDTFDADEQAAVSAYLTGGGKLFVSGSEIGWDLDNLNNGRAFYNNVLRADYVADDAGTYGASGAAGSIFEGLNLEFDDGAESYDVAFPDVLTPSGGSTAALNYNGNAGAAAVQYADGGTGQRVVMMGFPFESLVGDGNQTDVMARVLDYFGFATNPAQNLTLILDNDDGAPTYTETGNWITLSDPGVGGGTQRFSLLGESATATWSTALPATGDVEVFVQFDASSNRASGAYYEVTVGGETRNVYVDQRVNDFTWVSLGAFDDASGPVSVTLDAAASTGSGFPIVIADQVRIDIRGVVIEQNGDFNDDGVVDAADYTVYRDTLGQNVTPYTGADADGNGVVDAADYDIWRTTYGQTVAPAVALATAPIATLTAPTSEAEEPAATPVVVTVEPQVARQASRRVAPQRVASIAELRVAERALLLVTDSPESWLPGPPSLEQVDQADSAANAQERLSALDLALSENQPFGRRVRPSMQNL